MRISFVVSLKVLDQNVKNQLITIAAKITKVCQKSMEPEIGVRLFNNDPNHGVKYSVFIGDDDSFTIAKVREEVAYSVEKWSDSTHATRTHVSHKIRSEKSNFPGESVLSQKVINY